MSDSKIKPGYKQTEVGVIPEDWKIAPLEHITKQQGLVRGPFGGALKKEFFTKNGYKVYEQRNAIYGTVDKGDYYIDVRKFKELERFQVSHGDLIVSCSGTIGRIFEIPDKSPEGVINQALLKIRLDSTVIDRTFFLALFRWDLIQERIVDNSHGGAMQNLVGMDVFRKTLFPMPPLSEQQAIAAALSDADALLAALDKLIAKKCDLKQATMQELFIPKPTDKFCSLEEISFMKGRIGWQGLKQTEFTANAYEPFLITGMNFKDGEIRWDEVYHISEERYEMAKGIQLRTGDVLMTKDGTIGKVLYIDKIPSPGKASLNSHLLVFRPISGKYNPRYLYYQLMTKRFRDFIDLSKSGTTFFGISQASVGKFPVLLPPIKEQTSIASVLSDMDAEIAALEERREKMRAVKRGMMQELLTGKIRLVSQPSNVIPFPKSKPFEDAVTISVLTKRFGSPQYPLGRLRYNKLEYLMERHMSGVAEGFVRQAAGMYKPVARYGGGETTAQDKNYVRLVKHRVNDHDCFEADEKIAEAEGYFLEWHGEEPLQWMEQFRRTKNDELGLLTTVDDSMIELRANGQVVSVESVKEVIRNEPVWKAKLDSPVYSDANIARAIEKLRELFD